MNHTDGPEQIQIIKEKLHPDASQPRRLFPKGSIENLKRDIIKNGLLTPLDVCYPPDGRKSEFLIVDGHRRYYALKDIKGFGPIRCNLFPYTSQREIDKHRASVHFQRDDWNPVDRARFLGYYTATYNLTQEEVATEFNVEQGTISNWMLPLRDVAVLESLEKEEITFTQAIHLSRVDDAETRSEALLRTKKEETEDKYKTEAETKEIIKSLYSTPETPQVSEIEKGEGELPVHDGEGETIEEAKTDDSGREPLQPPSSETTGIVAETLGLTTDEERTTSELEKDEEALGEEKGIAAVEPSPETEKPVKDPFPIMSRVAKEFEVVKKMNDDNLKKQIDNLPKDKLKSVWKTRRKTGMECFCQSARWRGKLNGESYEMSKLICIRPCVVDLSVEKISSTKEIENAKSTLSDMKLKIDKNLNLLAKRGG